MQIHGKKFVPFISESKIKDRVEEMGRSISHENHRSELILLGNLNGAFVFMADLCRAISIPLKIQFVKYSSYSGTESSGIIKEEWPVDQKLKGKDILIVEDIIDSGLTLNHLVKLLHNEGVNSVKTASFLVKPDCIKYDVSIDYTGFEIPNDFVIGYGLDYDGIGRNLPSIYHLEEE